MHHEVYISLYTFINNMMTMMTLFFVCPYALPIVTTIMHDKIQHCIFISQSILFLLNHLCIEKWLTFNICNEIWKFISITKNPIYSIPCVCDFKFPNQSFLQLPIQLSYMALGSKLLVFTYSISKWFKIINVIITYDYY